MLFSDLKVIDLIMVIGALRLFPEDADILQVALAELRGRCLLNIELERTGEAPAVSG